MMGSKHGAFHQAETAFCGIDMHEAAEPNIRRKTFEFCADFDIGAETTAMVDMDGNWQDVTDSESPPKKELKGAVHFLIR
jgi:hypothetical protein